MSIELFSLFHLFSFLLCSYWTKIMLHAFGSFHHQTSYNPISLFLFFFFNNFSLFSHLQSFHVIFICEYCRSIYFYRYFHIYNFCWIITIILLTWYLHFIHILSKPSIYSFWIIFISVICSIIIILFFRSHNVWCRWMLNNFQNIFSWPNLRNWSRI